MFDQDENERFRQMLGGIIGNGPAPYDVTTSMEQPAQAQLSAPYMPQSAPSVFGGYTPPPAAAHPQYLDHVQGHQFGAGDIAMLGGILAALIGGGKNRGAIAGSLAGQYGGAIMQNNARADARNQQVDQYNSQLAAKDDPLERWKAEQTAKAQAGNMQLRQKELDAATAREQRIADHQALEDARDPIADALRQHQGVADIDVETNKRKLGNELDMRTQLAKILGKGQFAAPGGASGSNDPAKALKAKLAQAQLDGIDAGTVDPLTGKPKPKEPEPEELTPFDDTHITNAALFKKSAGNHANYQKLRQQDADLAAGAAAFDSMVKLLQEHGSESDMTEEGAAHRGEFDVARGQAQKAWGALKNLGVIQPGEAKTIDAALGADMSHGIRDVFRVFTGDERVGRLSGAGKAFRKGLTTQRQKMGLGDGPAEQPIGESADGGIKYSVDTEAEKRFNAGEGDTGTRTVTVTYTDGETEEFTGTEDQIQKLRGKSAVRSVQ